MTNKNKQTNKQSNFFAFGGEVPAPTTSVLW